MKKLIGKLKSIGGETLVEILVAVLIVAFGCMLIATMYASAMRMNVQAAQKDDQYYSDLSSIEQMFEGEHDGTGTVEITDEENNSVDMNIDTYGDSSNVAYKKGE